MRMLFLCVLVLCSACTHTGEKQEAVRSVKCDTAKLVGGYVEQSQYPGRVKAASEADVAFRVAGQIQQIAVSQGQFVRKGTVIARLDDRDYRTQLAATEAEYNRIKAEADRVIELYKKQSATPNDYDKAVYGLQQITAKLEAHRNALEDTRLKAPFDGYIQKRHFDAGETVSAGFPIVSMISSETPEVEINIPTADFIRRGEFRSATATIDIYPDQVYHLELIGINQKANLNQLYTTRFRIEGSPRPAPGMAAMVTIDYNTSTDALVQIPLSALNEDTVWVVEQNKVIRKPVTVKKLKSNGTVLVNGLVDGEIVVSGGTNSLKEGQQVEILPGISETNQGGIL